MNPLTRKHLSRRTILRGAGAAIALPFLDAMTPAFAATNQKASPTRMSFLYVPNGIVMEDWTPAALGRDYELTRILEPLRPYRDDVLVMSGLAHANANALLDGPGDHARAGACFLSGFHPKKTAGADILNGVTIDQLVAQHEAAATWIPSLELSCEDARAVGDCDSGYSCAYTNSLAWRAPKTPLPPETNPRMVFERLFGALDLGMDAEARAARAKLRKSVLDAVSERTAEITKDLGTADRRKLDEYLYGIREMERRIEKAQTQNRQLGTLVEKPSGIPATFAEYAKLMYDLQLIALQADLTRVVTMMMGREGSLRAYPEIGVPDSHHPLTHHRNNKEWIEQIAKINVFHVELFGYFLSRLKATHDGDGTLLDHSMIVYGSAIADGNKHTHEELPVLLAGRAGKRITTGRHVRYARNTPMTNLFLSMADLMGVHPESLGDSTGRVEQLGDL